MWNPFKPKDDWVKVVGPWHKVVMCHCGAYIVDGGVCEKCGHQDKWAAKIVRWEYEDSYSRGGMFHPFMECIRNEKLVTWTPDHCTVTEGKDV